MPDQTTVIIVDDDPAVLEHIGEALGSACLNVILFNSARAFFDQAGFTPVGCVVLEIARIDGFQVLSGIRAAGLTCPVIGMAEGNDVRLAVDAIKAGATDFIEKPINADALVACVKGAIASAKSNRSLDQEVQEAVRRIAALSPRERQVLDALMRGQPNKVIAFNLTISARTVEVHRARMMDRLGVTQLAQAIRLAVTAELGSERAQGKQPPGSWQPASRIHR
jgi:two-component system response regulator FixJ